MQDAEVVRVDLPPDEMQIRFLSDETIVFASSSGHCNLDCGYCVAAPVVKHQPSLTYEDLVFLKDQIGGKVFFIFSGRGDFFAGYRKSDRLLARLLDHDDVGVALDVNGVVIHCFEDLTPAQLAKVRHVNLTFHYRQLLDHKALAVWRKNALIMLRRHDNPDFFVNIVLSPSESALWEDAIAWYQDQIFAEYPKKLVLINDVSTPFGPAEEQVLQRVRQRFPAVIHDVRRGNFEAVLKSFDHVSCPAGQSYFRVWNDGAVQACPNVAELRFNGNLKDRSFERRSEPFQCHDVRHCDCYHIASAQRMTFLKHAGPAPARPLASRTIPLHLLRA